jgi:hypothetical protein
LFKRVNHLKGKPLQFQLRNQSIVHTDTPDTSRKAGVNHDRNHSIHSFPCSLRLL